MQGQYNTRSPAVKRLMREAQELAEPTYDYFAQPLSDNLFEWHFTVRGPAETEFDGGIYHGRIVLPPDYPMKPPNIIVLTPNGRFETGKKICLSISGHHPESWQPSWSIRTALLAIIGFMPTPGQGTIGSLDYPSEERKKLAKKSVHFTCEDCGGCPISELLKSDNKEEGSESKTAEEAKEIIKKMSLKGEDKDKKESTSEQPQIEETEEEKYKRARKLYANRMENIIRKRLNQNSRSLATTSTNSSSEAGSSQTTNVVQRQSPRPTLGGDASGPTPERPAASQPRRPREQSRQAGQGESRSYTYDIIIAVIILVIALLLYRRFNMFSQVTTGPTPPPSNGN